MWGALDVNWQAASTSTPRRTCSKTKPPARFLRKRTTRLRLNFEAVWHQPRSRIRLGSKTSCLASGLGAVQGARIFHLRLAWLLGTQLILSTTTFRAFFSTWI